MKRAARTYKRNKLGQFAKGGAVSMKAGTGGGSEAVLSTKALMSDAATTTAAFKATRSSGSSKSSGKSIDMALFNDTTSKRKR